MPRHSLILPLIFSLSFLRSFTASFPQICHYGTFGRDQGGTQSIGIARKCFWSISAILWIRILEAHAHQGIQFCLGRSFGQAPRKQSTIIANGTVVGLFRRLACFDCGIAPFPTHCAQGSLLSHGCAFRRTYQWCGPQPIGATILGTLGSFYNVQIWLTPLSSHHSQGTFLFVGSKVWGKGLQQQQSGTILFLQTSLVVVYE